MNYYFKTYKLINYYIKYNGSKANLFPWELWSAYKILDCFGTKSAASERADFRNEIIIKEIIKKASIFDFRKGKNDLHKLSNDIYQYLRDVTT